MTENMAIKKAIEMHHELIIQDELDSFINKVTALSSSYPIAESALHDYHLQARKNSIAFFKKYVEKSSKGKYRLKNASRINQSNDVRNEVSTSHIAEFEVIPESLFVSLLSVFDNFLGKILRKVYINKPLIFSNSTETISLDELTKFSDYNQVLNYLVDKEVSNFLRNKNHVDQFTILENKFGIPLRKDLKNWNVFVELTERRNLIVHNDGYVNDYYIKVLEQNGIKVSKNIKIGERLGVNKEYFDLTRDCLFEIGIKLAYVICNKSFPQDSKAILHSLSDHTSFELLRNKQYKMAQCLLEFCLLPSFKKDDLQRKIIIINLALAHKFLENNQEAIKIIDNEDWSSVDNELNLALAIIKDDVQEAKKYMLKVGKDFSKGEYLNLPLFYQFRKTKEFSDIYYKIFKEKYEILESQEAPKIEN